MTSGSIQQHLAEAQRAMHAGQVDKARHHLDAVIELDPTEPNARNALGLFALDQGDARGAAAHFEIACDRDPKAQPLWMNLARAHRELCELHAHL